MFGIGAGELAIILIFAFLIFGPDKLPQIAKTVGRAISKFKVAQEEMNQVVKTEVYDPANDKEQPFQKSIDKLSKLDDQQQVKTESFAARKAKYDQERAARKAAEADGSPESATGANEEKPSRPAVSADELYGNVSQAKKPAPRAKTDDKTAGGA